MTGPRGASSTSLDDVIPGRQYYHVNRRTAKPIRHATEEAGSHFFFSTSRAARPRGSTWTPPERIKVVESESPEDGTMSSKPIALVNARVIGADRAVIENGALVIRDGVIVDVGTRGSVEIPEDAEVIDVGGRTVMPGLIDAHMHLTGMRTGDLVKEPLITPFGVFIARAVRDLEALINAGFTTIGDAGSLVALHLKYAVAEGSVTGPRIVAAGLPLSQTFGHGDVHYLPVEWVDYRTTRKLTPLATLICDGVDECRKAARYALREGADYIKIMTSGGVLSEKDRPEYVQFTLNEIRAIVEEAEAAGRFVHAHAQGSKGIMNAIEGGVKVIAHAIFMDDEAIEEAKERSVIVIPTFSIVERLLEIGAEAGIPEWGLKKAEEVHEIHMENIRRAYRAGVKIAAGTDFIGGPFKHGENALEIQLLVERIGMSPMEAIIAATRNAAEAVGLASRIGTLTKGKLADVIVVDGNPLVDVKILREADKILMVIKEGVIVKDLLRATQRARR